MAYRTLQAAYGIALLALGAGSGTTPIDDFNLGYCTCVLIFILERELSDEVYKFRYFVDDELLNLSAVPALLLSAFDAILKITTGGTVVKSEPLLRQ